MPFVIIAAVIAIICVARYYHNKKERNKEITWQEVQKQTDTKRNTISIDTSENFFGKRRCSCKRSPFKSGA